MKFFFDIANKILFGWSAKCGSTHVKNIYNHISSLEKNKEILDNIKEENEEEDNIFDFSNYTLILIIRNPYERIISGFIDKYKRGGEFRHLWPTHIPLTFRNFVNELINGNFKTVDRHHLTPQLSEDWCETMKTHDKLFMFDINNIDYNLLEKIYNKPITKEILKFKGEHCNKNTEIIDFPVYDLLIDEYESKKPSIKSFYDDDICLKIDEFYKDDFSLFKENGFIYLLTK